MFLVLLFLIIWVNNKDPVTEFHIRSSYLLYLFSQDFSIVNLWTKDFEMNENVLEILGAASVLINIGWM